MSLFSLASTPIHLGLRGRLITYIAALAIGAGLFPVSYLLALGLPLWLFGGLRLCGVMMSSFPRDTTLSTSRRRATKIVAVLGIAASALAALVSFDVVSTIVSSMRTDPMAAQSPGFLLHLLPLNFLWASVGGAASAVALRIRSSDLSPRFLLAFGVLLSIATPIAMLISAIIAYSGFPLSD